MVFAQAQREEYDRVFKVSRTKLAELIALIHVRHITKLQNL
jgi:hypothetical protein